MEAVHSVVEKPATQGGISADIGIDQEATGRDATAAVLISARGGIVLPPCSPSRSHSPRDANQSEDIAPPRSSPTCSGKPKPIATTSAGDNGGKWDISRLNKPWIIDHELRRSLPFLARAKRPTRESAADKFLRLSKLSLPEAAVAVDGDDRADTPITLPLPLLTSAGGSQRSLLVTPETRARYFGASAKSECYTIFRQLAAQKYSSVEPLSECLEMHPHEGSLRNGSESERGQEPEARPKPTARHKFSALCLERELPPCLRLIIRNYFSPEINVSHMAIGDDLAVVLATCLVDLPMVTGLNVRDNRLADRGLRALVSVVVAKHDLFHLDLSENKVDGAAAEALATYLAAPTCALQTLKLSQADVDDGEVVPLLAALTHNKSLRALELSRNLVGNTEHRNVVQPWVVTGGEALAQLLPINYTLTSLDLSWNYLRLGGAVALGRALAENTGLRELNLAYNALGNAGAQALGEALRSNATLEKLDLRHNNIPAQSAQTLASALRLGRCALTHVALDGNPLGHTGGRALLHAVASCPARQLHVSLEGCNFDVAEGDSFDPSEATGTYELDLSIPYERAIALELLRVATTKQGCKFLSVTHVTASGTGSGTAKQRRPIKLELRERATADQEDLAARRRLLKTAGILTDASANEEVLRAHHRDAASLEALFHELDEDDSGFVDANELKRGLQTLGLAMREEEIPRLIAQYDLDGTGTIEVDEFVELLASVTLAASVGQATVAREVVDMETNAAWEIPQEGQLLVEFVDLHVSADQENAHSPAGIARLIDNISQSKNKQQMLQMAKSGLFFGVHEAQMLLESVSDAVDVTQAVPTLLPNMVDPANAYMLIDRNLDASQRLRLQHVMGTALQPLLGLGTGHYRLDLGSDLDRMALQKLVENSNRTTFLKKKEGRKDTSQHGNYHGFRNETFHSKPAVLTPQFLDKMPRFGVLEFDYVQLGRQPRRPASDKRFAQLLRNLQLEQMAPAIGHPLDEEQHMSAGGHARYAPLASASSPTKRAGSTGVPPSSRSKARQKPRGSQFPPLRMNSPAMFAEFDRMKTVKNYLKFGDGLNHVVEVKPVAGSVAVSEDLAAGDGIPRPNEVGQDSEDDEGEDQQTNKSPTRGMQVHGEDAGDGYADDGPAASSSDDAVLCISRDGRETCTGKRLLLALQWHLATRWISAQQAVRLLALWPRALAAARCDAVCVIFDRLVDLHNFNGILAALSDHEAAQCLYRLGWLNIWTPLMPDDYYELHLAQYEEREVAKVLVRLAIDEPGENWQRETFGWTRDELIPGWELNLSWLKDGGFPEKGYLCLEYYSGADKGCGPVWPSRRELAATTLCGLPAEVDEIVQYVDSRCLQKR